MHTLTESPTYYSETYGYRSYPAKVGSRAGHFAVWTRDTVRPNPNHVTWSPELVVLVAEQYRTPEWHAERAEMAARPELAVGELVKLGELVIEIAPRCAEYIDSVPCQVIPYTASSWDYAFAIVDPTGAISKGPQYATLAEAEAEADRLNAVFTERANVARKLDR